MLDTGGAFQDRCSLNVAKSNWAKTRTAEHLASWEFLGTLFQERHLLLPGRTLSQESLWIPADHSLVRNLLEASGERPALQGSSPLGAPAVHQQHTAESAACAGTSPVRF